MKLIHLSDLHIGKRIEAVSLIEDQKYILDQIVQIIADEKPNAVLIAGDVYDKSVPSAEAVELFDNFLFKLSKLETNVFIISGNHDSAERLAFGGRLMQQSRVHISPAYNGKIEPIVLSDEYGETAFWMLPFIKPAHVKRFFNDEEIEDYTAACRTVVEKMKISTSIRNVLIAHQFVTGADTCESEELSVGGTDNVDASVFKDFDYVALGHLHGPQNVGSNKMRYCGTPLKYSFSEENHIKSITVVQLDGKDDLTVNTIPLRPKRDMRRIRGSFDELMGQEHLVADDYVHIILTNENDVEEAAGKLRIKYPNMVHLSYDNTRTAANNIIDAAQNVKLKPPLELFDELYELQNNRKMDMQEKEFVQKLIESVWERAL